MCLFLTLVSMHKTQLLAFRRFSTYLMKEKEDKANQNQHSEVLQMSTKSSKLGKLILGIS